ncbi:MAG: YwaF family protein [Ferrimicrobium sp.]
MSGSETPQVYVAIVAVAALIVGGGCAAARRRPGRWTLVASHALAVVLAAKGGLWIYTTLRAGPWTVQTGLPLFLCDAAVFIAAAACWWRLPLLVEIVYFWGLAGVLQAVLTPELPDGFPHLLFFQYTVGHLAVVAAALYLVIGLQITPRPGAMFKVFGVTVGYTVAVGVVDWVTDADYMFLRHRPHTWSLLSILGPWPWYLFIAAFVAFVFFLLLDAPFWARRHDGTRGTSRENRQILPEIDSHGA